MSEKLHLTAKLCFSAMTELTTQQAEAETELVRAKADGQQAKELNVLQLLQLKAWHERVERLLAEKPFQIVCLVESSVCETF